MNLGRPELTEIAVIPTGTTAPIDGLDSRVLRSAVSLKGAREAVRDFVGANTNGPLARELALVAPPRRRRRSPAQARLLRALIAAGYASALAGGSHSPASDAGAQLHLRPDEAREQLRRARAEGFLERTTRGKAGGHLTAAAVEVIRGAFRDLGRDLWPIVEELNKLNVASSPELDRSVEDSIRVSAKMS